MSPSIHTCRPGNQMHAQLSGYLWEAQRAPPTSTDCSRACCTGIRPPVLTGEVILVLAVGLVTGGLIGAVGVGGVLLAPLLVLLAGFELHQAVAIASWSFIFTGITGTAAYTRRGSINWSAAAWLALGVIPSAIIGARVNVSLPEAALTVVLCILVAASGLRTLTRPPDSRTQTGLMPGSAILVLFGSLVGFGSALTGTGGPVLLIPLLLLFSVPPLAAIGVSQAIQLPVAVFASVGYLLFSEINLAVGTALGVTQALGVLLGARLAHALPAPRLRQFVGIALLATAVLLLLQL